MEVLGTTRSMEGAAYMETPCAEEMARIASVETATPIYSSEEGETTGSAVGAARIAAGGVRGPIPNGVASVRARGHPGTEQRQPTL
jgi:hypothetical protein